MKKETYENHKSHKERQTGLEPATSISVSFGIATALSNGQVSVLAVVVEPIVEILHKKHRPYGNTSSMDGKCQNYTGLAI